MPYCPRCEEEYETGVAECAECGVGLLATLDDVRAAKTAEASAAKAAAPRPGRASNAGAVAEADLEPEFPEIPVYCADERVAAAVVRCLEDRQVPSFLYESAVVVDGAPFRRIAVPPEFAGSALRLVRTLLGRAIGRRGRGFEVLDLSAAEEDEAAAAAIPEDAARLVRDAEGLGDAGVEAIEKLVLGAHLPQGVRAFAAQALARMDSERSRAAADRALARAIAAQDDAGTHELVTGMHAGSPWSLSAETRALIRSKDPATRALAATAAGNLHCEEALEDLVGALSDPEIAVRGAAIDALFTLAGETFGYEPDSPEAKRREAVEMWRQFLASREG